MPVVSHTVTVDASPETVWAFVSDMERIPEWVTFTDEMRDFDSGEVREGFRYVEYGGVGPIDSESEWEVVEVDPPRRQVHVGDLGIMKPTLTVTIEPRHGGSQWTQTVEFEAFPRFRPLGRLLEALFVRRTMDRELRKTMEAGAVLVERLADTDTTPDTATTPRS